MSQRVTLPRLGEESADTEASFGALQSSVGNLPLKQLGYHTRVVGLATQTVITQTYYNPFDECIEATYIFPLEGGQAVTDCEMWVGDRVVRARLKERGQARRDYRRAIAQGYRAALLEENRSETFSMKVGNIPAGEAVQIRIQTVGQLPVVRGEWTLRLPLVVAPRYTSGFPLPKNAVGDGISLDTDQAPDASTVTPPTWLPGFASPVDLRISVDIDLGELTRISDWPQQIRSSLHAVSLMLNDSSQQSDHGSCRISVYPGERVNRDFILRGDLHDEEIRTSLVIEPPSSASSQASAQSGESFPSESVTSWGTFALHIVPPQRDEKLPRDIVFLLDRSGSMSGWKMDAARRGISRLVDTLRDDDRFLILAFDDDVESPMDGWLNKQTSWAQATDANRYKAVRWLANIESRGGTEMAMAIEHGLQPFLKEGRHGGDPETASPAVRSRAMVLVTDGQITGEDSVLRLLGTVAEEQRPRLFCLGVDRSVNASVLQRISQYTGGIFELVESEHRLTQVLDGFADEMGAPAITDLKVQVRAPQADLSIAPSRHRTLYAGRCRSIYGRAPYDQPLRITLQGKLASGATWQKELVAEPKPACGRPVLLPSWGRARVRDLEDQLIADPAADHRLRGEILSCSLACNVLCRFTAFVAVDETQQVNLQADLHRIVQPVEYPEGWQHPAVPPLSNGDLIPIPGKTPPAKVDTSVLPEGFADLMLKRGIVSRDQLAEAERHAQHSGQNVGDVLVMMQYATSDQVGRMVAEAYQLPYVDLRQVVIDEHAVEMVPESIARENSVMPYFAEAGTLTVLMSNPADIETIEKLRFILNRDIRTMVATRDEILAAINHYYGQVEGESADSMLQEFTDTAIDFTETDDDLLVDMGEDFAHMPPSSGAADLDEGVCLEAPPLQADTFGILPQSRQRTPRRAVPSEAPVVRLVTLIISEAVTLRASHIILQPSEDAIAVIYIIDGSEVERDLVPRRLFAAIITRLKVLANVDVSVHDQPQSGRIDVTVGGHQASCVVHFAPLEEAVTILLDFTAQRSESVSASPPDLPEAVRNWWQRHAPGAS